ncbi:MAG: hypothetical protein WA102_06225 [Candidatus Methanoperedens sp.]
MSELFSDMDSFYDFVERFPVSKSNLIGTESSISNRFHLKCPKPVGMVENHWTRELAPIACKSWDCPVCAFKIKMGLLDRVALNFGQYQDDYFLTLTDHLHPADITKHQNHFMTVLKRTFDVDKTFWTKEYTPPSHPYTDWKGVTRLSVGGVAHLHELLSFNGDNIPSESEMSDIWLRANGDSYIVDLQKVNLRNPAGYMCKYMDKAFESYKYLKNENRYQFSRNCLKVPEFSGVGSTGWQYVSGSSDDLKTQRAIDADLARVMRFELMRIKRLDSDYKPFEV